MNQGTFELQFQAPQIERLRQLAVLGEPVRLDDLDGPEARAQLADADVLITSWGAPPITSEHLAAAPRLRAVLHAAGTVRGLVPDEAWDRGIVVTSAADENARPVAEFTLAAIILAGKRAPFSATAAARSASSAGRASGAGPSSCSTCWRPHTCWWRTRPSPRRTSRA